MVKQSEAQVLAECLKESSKMGDRLFRNNSGMLYNRDGTPVRYGLCKGSSDLIGFTILEITHNMVGQQIPIFTAIECKNEKGKLSKEQKSFLDFLQSKNSVCGVARDKEDIGKIKNAYVEKMSKMRD